MRPCVLVCALVGTYLIAKASASADDESSGTESYSYTSSDADNDALLVYGLVPTFNFKGTAKISFLGARIFLKHHFVTDREKVRDKELWSKVVGVPIPSDTGQFNEQATKLFNKWLEGKKEWDETDQGQEWIKENRGLLEREGANVKQEVTQDGEKLEVTNYREASEPSNKGKRALGTDSPRPGGDLKEQVAETLAHLERTASEKVDRRLPESMDKATLFAWVKLDDHATYLDAESVRTAYREWERKTDN